MYVADTGAPGETRVYDLDGETLRNGKRFVKLDVLGYRVRLPPPTAFAATWTATCGAGPGGSQVVSPAGELIGMIRLPENCANICFGGTKRNRLFMAASQSLYVVYVGVLGAHIT